MNVDVKHLRREFGKTIAVDDVSFAFHDPHVFGFVGPNGAGKTTTMRILATLDEPSGGDAFIDGTSITEYPEEARRCIGFVPDSLPTHSDITVHEYIDFFARAYGLKRGERTRAVDTVEDFTQLTDIREKTLKALSKGMKQRVSLARALVHDPPILIMDEPAAGLDPRARVELRELLRLLAERGKAILISSHILTELTEICSGVIIIEQGKILETGTIREVAAKCAPTRTIVIRPLDRVEALQRELLQMPAVNDVKIAGPEILAEVDGDEEICCDILAAILARDFRIIEYSQKKADLEHIFMSVTKGGVQ